MRTFFSLAYLMLASFLVSCASNPSTDSVVDPTPETRETFGELIAAPGKVKFESFRVECWTRLVIVEPRIIAIGNNNEDWLPTVSFALESEDQVKEIQLVTVRFKSGSKLRDGIKLLDGSKKPEYFWLGESKIGEPTTYKLAWEGEVMSLEYGAKRTHFDSDSHPTALAIPYQE